MMPRYRVSAEALIDAPPADAYAIVADYRDGHPRILPRPPFVALEVEQGGTGEGTIIFCRMRVLGRVQSFRARITEPEPGRLLRETIDETGAVTTFTVDPDGQGSRVIIATEFPTRGGLLGSLERFLITRWLGRVYRREIEQLAFVASGRTKGPDAPHRDG